MFATTNDITFNACDSDLVNLINVSYWIVWEQLYWTKWGWIPSFLSGYKHEKMFPNIE